MKYTSIKIMLLGIVLLLISLFFLGVSILQQGGSTGGGALAFLIAGIIVSLIGLIWDKKI